MVLGVLIIVMLLFVADGLATIDNFKKIQGSIKIYDINRQLIHESVKNSEGYQTPVKLSTLPEYIPNSIISAEDARFYKHFGIDPVSIIRAVVSNIKSKSIVSGGSTITQQVSRQNLPINTGLLRNKYIRKVREINAAMFLEVRFSKNVILEKYINSVYFGNNSYGIEAASIIYYGKPSGQLSLAESALLAGSIRSPGILNPKDATDAGIKRRNEVLDLMFERSYITEEELNTTRDFPAGLNFRAGTSRFLHFVDYALNEALQKLNFDDLSDLKGLHIYTTLNPSISLISEEAARDQVYVLSEKHKLSNAATVTLSVKDSSILSMIGSVDYFNEDIEGAINMAISLRQPGSALKPITYAQAFYEELLTPDSIIMDEKTTFLDKGGNSFVPYNYNGVFNGPVTARVALASSLNLPAVKVLEMVGVEDMISTSQKLGLKNLDNPDRYDLSVTLGGGEISLLNLANVYASFSRGGIYKDVHCIESIEDYDGNLLYEYMSGEGQEVWGDRSREVAGMIYDILSDKSAKVLGFGRNNVLVLPFEAASKTGTTTDWHDNWTFGYVKDTSDDFVVGVWVGNADRTPMYDIDGVTGAGPIWRNIMTATYGLLLRKPELQERTNIILEKEMLKTPDENKLPDHRDFQNVNNSDTKEKDPVGETVSETCCKITNPAQGSVYQILPHESKFERIKMEVTVFKNIFAVEYFLDGASLGTSYNEDNFKYLWNPVEGVHTLEAYFKDAGLSVVSKDSSNFTIHVAQP